MKKEEAKAILGDGRAYLASRASLENELLAGHSYIEICNAIKALQEPKIDRLYRWLNDMRLGIAPDETTPQDERGDRLAQVDVIDDIMEWLEKNEQEPKTGHWIISPNDCFAHCSECGLHGDKGIYKNYRWCPNCGCRMVEPQESEEQTLSNSEFPNTWQKHTDASGNSWHVCPACGHIAYTLTRFCPDCGARLEAPS